MKVFSGIVIANKMPKTVTVEVERFLSHPLYKKRFKRSRKYQVHSETELRVGDKVRFVATRPISKTKKWKVLTGRKQAEVTTSVKEVKTEEKKVAKTTKVAKAIKKGK